MPVPGETRRGCETAFPERFRRLHEFAATGCSETGQLVRHVAITTAVHYTIIGQAREAELVGAPLTDLAMAMPMSGVRRAKLLLPEHGASVVFKDGVDV